jgi:hypothetical protein
LGKLIPILAFGAGVVLVYMYMTGQLSSITSGANAGNAGAIANQAGQQAQQASTQLYAQPWFWAAALAVVGAFLLRWLWGNMNGPIRGAFIVVLTVLVVVFVTTVGGHR